MKTEQEKIAYIKSLIPEFKQHKADILDAYGTKQYLTTIKQRLILFNDLLQKLQEVNPDTTIEDVVNHFNDEVDKRCIAEGGSMMDNLHNKQLNIIVGMRLRGFDV